MKVKARVRICRYGWFVEAKERLLGKWEQVYYPLPFNTTGFNTFKTRAEAQERADAIERGEL